MRQSPLASPLYATSLRDVAPVVMVTAEHDFLRGEAEDYAVRLRGDDVPVEMLEYPGQIHGFFEMLGVLTDARRAVNAAADAVRRAFAQHSQSEPDK
jgi:acetyl esterase